VIEARDVTLRFGARTALAGVTLTVARGELLGLVGAAGSGKSSLLKVLCLLERPTRGQVLLEGRALDAMSDEELSRARARIGFCFQNLALFDRMDATANVAYPLVRRGVARADAWERAAAQLRAVGLGHALAKHPHEMSGGMRRRLALARAMVARPDVGLYDDPFTGLDPVACARIARLIRDAHDASGGVTIVAAGDPSPLFDVCDRLLLLEEGRVIAVEVPAAFRRSGDAAIRRYLGAAGAA
jgi:phospholipid/cholesterol/gamma-HCH transport system ATP-binding protein